jgi:hypothetical protein
VSQSNRKEEIKVLRFCRAIGETIEAMPFAAKLLLFLVWSAMAVFAIGAFWVD